MCACVYVAPPQKNIVCVGGAPSDLPRTLAESLARLRLHADTSNMVVWDISQELSVAPCKAKGSGSACRSSSSTTALLHAACNFLQQRQLSMPIAKAPRRCQRNNVSEFPPCRHNHCSISEGGLWRSFKLARCSFTSS